jgi:hypothetical protein
LQTESLSAVQDFSADLTFPYLETMRIVSEQVGQSEDLELGYEAFEGGRRHFRHADASDLKELEQLALGSELLARVDVDPHRSARPFLQSFAHEDHGMVNGMGRVEAVTELDDGDVRLAGAPGEQDAD